MRRYGERKPSCTGTWASLLHLQARYAEARAHLEASAAQYRASRAHGATRPVRWRDWRASPGGKGAWTRPSTWLPARASCWTRAIRSTPTCSPSRARQPSTGMQWPQAAACFEQALNLATASQDQRMIAWLWVNLGMAMWKLERYQDAIRCYHEAIHVFSVVKRSRAPGRCADGPWDHVRAIQRSCCGPGAVRSG